MDLMRQQFDAPAVDFHRNKTYYDDHDQSAKDLNRIPADQRRVPAMAEADNAVASGLHSDVRRGNHRFAAIANGIAADFKERGITRLTGQTVKASHPADGSVLRSQPADRIDGEAHWNVKPIENPTGQAAGAIAQLRKAFAVDAGRAGLNYSVDHVQSYPVPDALSGLAGAIKQLFNVDLAFVGTRGIDRRLDFNGVYLGGNTLFVNIDADEPASAIIGHEFLHYLKQTARPPYDKFVRAAEYQYTDEELAARMAMNMGAQSCSGASRCRAPLVTG